MEGSGRECPLRVVQIEQSTFNSTRADDLVGALPRFFTSSSHVPGLFYFILAFPTGARKGKTEMPKLKIKQHSLGKKVESRGGLWISNALQSHPPWAKDLLHWVPNAFTCAGERWLLAKKIPSPSH